MPSGYRESYRWTWSTVLTTPACCQAMDWWPSWRGRPVEHSAVQVPLLEPPEGKQAWLYAAGFLPAKRGVCPREGFLRRERYNYAHLLICIDETCAGGPQKKRAWLYTTRCLQAGRGV